MNKAHPLSQLITGFLAVSILTAIYVATPNRIVLPSNTPAQADGTTTGP